ncbi:MAG: DUF1700 domain-containing protein [Ruminococcaceae bacterium]|nr:DUF1700 domain-containing protein [Oscillospiraceae bacterium]
MKRIEFMSIMEEALRPLSYEDRRHTLNYYEELLQDMIEDGMNEDAATAHLGDPKELADAILAQIPHDEPAKETAKEDLSAYIVTSAKDAMRDTMRVAEDTIRIAKDTIKEATTKTGFWENLFSGLSKSSNISVTVDGKSATNEGAAGELAIRGVRHVKVNWISGNVNISGDDLIDSIEFSERAWRALRPEEHMRVHCENDTLYITEFEGQLVNAPRKTLELRLPQALANSLDSLEIKTATAQTYLDHLHMQSLRYHTVSGDLDQTESDSISAVNAELRSVSGDIDLSGRFQTLKAFTTSGDVKLAGSAGEVQINTVSGDLNADLLSSQSLSMATTSGDADLRGGWDSLHFKAISGDLTAELTRSPIHLNVETSSGDAELEIPAESDFTLTYHTSSGDLSSDFDYRKEGRTYHSYCGQGTNQWNVKTTSGDLTLTEA